MGTIYLRHEEKRQPPLCAIYSADIFIIDCIITIISTSLLRSRQPIISLYWHIYLFHFSSNYLACHVSRGSEMESISPLHYHQSILPSAQFCHECNAESIEIYLHFASLNLCYRATRVAAIYGMPLSTQKYDSNLAYNKNNAS